MGVTLYVMCLMIGSIVVKFFLSILYINIVLMDFEYSKMGKVFGSPYCMKNDSIFEFFWGKPTNVQHVQVGLPLDFTSSLISYSL